MLFSQHIGPHEDPAEPYTSVPATSGDHSPDDPIVGVLDDPLPDRELVPALEVGQVVVAYDADALPGTEREALVDRAQGDLDGRVTVAPYAQDMGAPLVINGWGVRQACEGFEGEALDRFVAAFQRRAPGADS